MDVDIDKNQEKEKEKENEKEKEKEKENEKDIKNEDIKIDDKSLYDITEKNLFSSAVDKEKKDEINKDVFKGNVTLLSKKLKIKKNRFDFDPSYDSLIRTGKKIKKVYTGVTKTINDLLEKKAYHKSEIYEKLSGQGITDDGALFLSMLILCKNGNRNVPIPNLLNNRTFTCNVVIESYDNNSNYIFTNDKLYWMSKIYPILKERGIEKLVTADDAKISLQTFATEQKYDYMSCYVRDYQENFSFIIPDAFPPIYLGRLKAGYFKEMKIPYDEENFIYNGKEYKCLNFKEVSAKVIYQSNISKDKLLEYIKNTVTYESKKNFKEGMKVNKIGKGETIYISEDNLQLTDFSPSAIKVRDKMDTCSLFSFKINLIELENLIYTTVIKNKKEFIKTIGQIIDIPNLVNWDTINLFIDFVYVEALTKYNNAEYDYIKDILLKFNDQLFKKKLSFKAVRNVVVPILKLFDMFYTSFKTKIDTNKLEKIADSIDKYGKKLKLLREGKLLKELQEFIEENNLQKTFATIYNCIKEEALVINSIFVSFDKLMQIFKKYDQPSFLSEAKELGKAIYGLYMQRNNCEQLIDKITTPAIFLGNISFGDDIVAYEAFSKVLKDKKIENEKQMNKEDLAIEVSAISNEDAIKYILSDYLNTVMGGFPEYNFTEKELQEDGTLESFLKTKPFEGENSDVYMELIGKGKINMVEDKSMNLSEISKFQKTFLDNIYEKYKDYLNKIDSDKNKYVSDMKNKINNLESALKKYNNSGYIPIPKENIEVYQMENLKIITLDESDPENADKIPIYTEMREKGITDDITAENYDELNSLKDDDEVKYDKLVKSLQLKTQKKWGPNGTSFKLLKKVPKTKSGKSSLTRSSGAYKHFISSKPKKPELKSIKEEEKEEKKEGITVNEDEEPKEDIKKEYSKYQKKNDKRRKKRKNY